MVHAILPQTRETLDQERDADVPELVARLNQEISDKLAVIETALKGARTPEAERLTREVAELRALVSRALALQASLQERVERQIAERTRELASLSNFLQTHAEREKALLARELHDSLGGILTPAKMDLAWLESRLGSDPEYAPRMQRLSALIDQGIDLKRRIIENLRPSLLDHLGLASAVQWFVDEVCRDAKIECHLRISERLERLTPDTEIALYRLVQEGVGNIVKHARAKRIDLDLERTERGLELRLGDDGVGISDVNRAKQSSHGMAGMIHRVRCINGSVDIDSHPGQGTRIKVFVPLPAAKA